MDITCEVPAEATMKTCRDAPQRIQASPNQVEDFLIFESTLIELPEARFNRRIYRGRRTEDIGLNQASRIDFEA